MSKKSTNHVVPSSSGWSVKKSGATKASKTFDTKDKAVKYGRDLSKNEKLSCTFIKKWDDSRKELIWAMTLISQKTKLMSFENSVFINCPFEATYINDLLKPMIYVIIKNGLTPRLSLEVSDSGQARLEKITEIIKSCKYSIHDLSIVKSKKANEFARMNMPFELGIDYGLRKSGMPPMDTKQYLVLEAKKYDYMKAMSDFNGFDIRVHGNKAVELFECLYTWFSETLKINKQDPPLKLSDDFWIFNTNLFEEKAKELGSEKFAKNYVEKVSIAEYIEEIRERL